MKPCYDPVICLKMSKSSWVQEDGVPLPHSALSPLLWVSCSTGCLPVSLVPNAGHEPLFSLLLPPRIRGMFYHIQLNWIFQYNHCVGFFNIINTTCLAWWISTYPYLISSQCIHVQVTLYPIHMYNYHVSIKLINCIIICYQITYSEEIIKTVNAYIVFVNCQELFYILKIANPPIFLIKYIHLQKMKIFFEKRF